MRYLDTEFVALMPPGRLGTVVELCCGTGEGYTRLADKADFAIGLDVSIEMLKRARKLHPDLRLIQGDATALPMRDGCADVVVIHKADLPSAELRSRPRRRRRLTLFAWE